MNMYIIYALMINQKPYYVGMTTQNVRVRAQQDNSFIRCRHPKVGKKIRDFGRELPETVILASCHTLEYAKFMKNRYIHQLDTLENGLNTTLAKV